MFLLLFHLVIFANFDIMHATCGGGGGSGAGGVVNAVPRANGGPSGGESRDYIVDIWIFYHWQLENETDSDDLVIEYAPLWSTVESLLDVPDHHLNSISDSSGNKHDLVFNPWCSQQTEILHMQIDSTCGSPSASEPYVNYVRQNMADVIKAAFMFPEWNIVEVRCFIALQPCESCGWWIWLIAISALACFKCLIYYNFCSDSSKFRNVKNEMKTPDFRWVEEAPYDKEGTSDPFVSGMFEGYYHQNDRKYDMAAIRLEFDHARQSCTGSGTDCVGDYNIIGWYSNTTKRMALKKTYIRGTGDRTKNLGHVVRIRLEHFRIRLGHTTTSQFRGIWYVHTNAYEGTGTWVIESCDGTDDEGDVELGHMKKPTRVLDQKTYQQIYMKYMAQ